MEDHSYALAERGALNDVHCRAPLAALQMPPASASLRVATKEHRNRLERF
jgi:hypothetical protein